MPLGVLVLFGDGGILRVEGATSTEGLVAKLVIGYRSLIIGHLADIGQDVKRLQTSS